VDDVTSTTFGLRLTGLEGERTLARPGAIARLLMPGRDPIGVFGTIVLGIAGSFVGGFLQNLIENHTLTVHSFHAVGLIGSVIGAWVLLLLLRLTGLEGRRRRY
jgi:uncharacterized membrane protein YeaQ/YmgE (transglycosylase-associated protein family)